MYLLRACSCSVMCMYLWLSALYNPPRSCFRPLHLNSLATLHHLQIYAVASAAFGPPAAPVQSFKLMQSLHLLLCSLCAMAAQLGGGCCPGCCTC